MKSRFLSFFFQFFISMVVFVKLIVCFPFDLREILLRNRDHKGQFSAWTDVSKQDFAQSGAAFHSRIVCHEDRFDTVLPFGSQDGASADHDDNGVGICSRGFLYETDLAFMQSQVIPIPAPGAGIGFVKILGCVFTFVIVIISGNDDDGIGGSCQLFCV